MNLYMKQKVFSWGDKFNIFDENQQIYMTVKGQVFSFGKKLHIFDAAEQEVGFLHEKLLSFMPKYFLELTDGTTVEIKKEFTFLKPKYSILPIGWNVNGNFFEHNYEVTDEQGAPMVSVRKKIFSFGDSYEIYISPEVNPVLAVGIVLAIDATLEKADNNSN